MILSCDPSTTVFGYAILDGMSVLTSGAFKVQTTMKGTSAWRDKQQKLAENLCSIIDEAGITEIQSEFPHGSKSAMAAWSLSMVTSVITGVAVARNIPVKFCLEGQAKKCLLGRATNVEKIHTRRKIVDIYGKYGYIEAKHKYIAEAVADALSVHNFFRYNANLRL